MWKWIKRNKKWIFSGFGAALLAAMLSVLRLFIATSPPSYFVIGMEKQMLHTEEDKSRKIYGQNISNSVINQGDRIENLNVILKNTPNKSDPRIVDVSIEEPEEGFPVLDIKLRNIGDATVFFKRAEFDILEIGRLRNPRLALYNLVPVSGKYDVVFEGTKKVVKNISQAIAPNEVDRFTFSIAHKGGDPVVPTLFSFQLTLFYDEDEKKMVTRPIIMPVPSTIQCGAMTVIDDRYLTILENRYIIRKFASLQGIVSEDLKKIMENDR